MAPMEGKVLGTLGDFGKMTLNQCQAHCDKLNGCRSIAFCSDDKCYFHGKTITKLERQKDRGDKCFTSYQSCHGCILFNSYIKIKSIRLSFDFLLLQTCYEGY